MLEPLRLQALACSCIPSAFNQKGNKFFLANVNEPERFSYTSSFHCKVQDFAFAHKKNEQGGIFVRGVVSNTLYSLVSKGEDLADLIEKLHKDHSVRYVELRQTTLGPPYETPRCVKSQQETDGTSFLPVPAQLKKLIERFPEIEFNLAIQCPFFQGTFNLDDELWKMSVEATKVLLP